MAPNELTECPSMLPHATLNKAFGDSSLSLDDSLVTVVPRLSTVDDCSDSGPDSSEKGRELRDAVTGGNGALVGVAD